MRILALELSSGQGSIAWLENDRAPFLRTFANDRKHSGLFFQSLELCLKEFGRPEEIVVGLGPGSYAGVRISIAAAVGLRAASAAKLIGVASVLGIETAARDYCVIGDARRASFFFAQIINGRVAEGPSLHSATELEVEIEKSSLPLFASEPLLRFPKAALAYPSAGKLAVVVRDQFGEMTDTKCLQPIYLREPHITVPKASLASRIQQ